MVNCVTIGAEKILHSLEQQSSMVSQQELKIIALEM